jgi:hypothetical protein
MALFRPYIQEFILDRGTAANFGNTITFPIRNRAFWLEAILVNAVFKAGSTVAATASDWLRALIKRIQLRADERTGGVRTIVDVEGPALIDFVRELYGFDVSDNVYSQQNTSNGSTHSIQYLVPFRHPLIPEPNAYRTCLPLPRYGADPEVTITIASLTDIAGSLTAHTSQQGLLVKLMLLYREVIDPDNSFPHWKSELVTKRYTWPGTGAQAIEDVSQTGVLMYLHQQDFEASTGLKRWCLANEYTDEYALEYRTRPIIRGTPRGLRALSSIAQDEVVGGYNPANTICYDLLSELTRTDVYHFGSALDLTMNALRGGKLRILGSNVQANSQSRVTTYKLMVEPEKLLSGTV